MAVTETTRSDTWKLDPIHSSAAFEVKHNEISLFRGKFDEVGATLEYSAGQPVLTGTVDVTSIDVADENLKGHLLSPDFFDAERTPEITYVSKSADVDGQLIELDGELKIKGHAEPVKALGAINHVEADLAGSKRYGVDLTATIDRTAFGLDWNADLPKGGKALGNDVKLQVHLEFVPEQAE